MASDTEFWKRKHVYVTCLRKNGRGPETNKALLKIRRALLTRRKIMSASGNTYELVIVFNPDFESEGPLREQVEKVKSVIQASNGSVLQEHVWGKRQLAYLINKRQYGVYVVLVISGPNDLVKTLERQLTINDGVLRFLIVKKDKFAPDFNPRLIEETRFGSADDELGADEGVDDFDFRSAR